MTFWTRKVKFCFLRGPLRWLTAAKNAIVGWLLNFRIRMFVKSAILICGPQSTRKRTIFSTRWKMFSFKIFLMVFFSIKSFVCWDLKMFKDFSLACCDAPINVNPVKGECGQGVEIWCLRLSPTSGFWSCEATSGSGNLTLTNRSLVSIQRRLPSLSLEAFWQSRWWIACVQTITKL